MIKGGQAFSMCRELEDLQKQDGSCFLLGSSHAYRGYDPGFFAKHGIQLFNAGSSGQSLACSYELLKTYGNKFSNVILDLYPGSISEINDESLLTLMQNTPSDELALKLFALKPGVFSINNLLFRFLRINKQALYLESGYMGKGYLMTEMELEGEVPVPICHFDESQYMILEDIIKYCKNRNMAITLVSHPLPFPDDVDINYYSFKHQVDKLCKEFNLSFYDYTYKHAFDKTYFSDYNHLNVKGVKFFNEKFITDKYKHSNAN